MWPTRRNPFSPSLWFLGGAACLFGLVGMLSGNVASANASVPSATRELRVSIHRAGQWVEVDRLVFDRFYATRQVSLVQATARGGAASLVRVRLEKRGGGAAHVDCALVAGRAPLSVRGAELYKLVNADDDVADVSHGPVVLAFFVRPGEEARLTLRARIEPTVIGKTPFRFPRVNTGRPMTLASSFYAYRLGSRSGRFQVDGELAGEPLGAPFFQDAAYVDSGHPQGATFGWVRDDGQTLYVAMDFTSDNTMDGELDYARVFARVKGRVKVFTVRQSSRRWGRVGFTYTDRVGYQHKVYEMAIPLAELTDDQRPGQLVGLAFSAYGTSSTGAWDTQTMAYEPGSETYISRYWGDSSSLVHVQLFDVLGNPSGAPILVEAAAGNGNSKGGVVADPDTGLFLVTWDDANQVHGHLIDPVTGLDGTELLISDNSSGVTENSRLVYDPDLQRYLVIWVDDRTGTDGLYGRFLAPDGTPVAASFHIEDMDRQNTNGRRNTTNIVYNTADQELLVVFVRSDTVEAQRLDPTSGAPIGTRLTLEAGGVHPSVAYEPTSNTYLVVWHNDPSVATSFMRSRLVYPDGTMEPTQFPMPASNDMVSTAVAADPGSERFLVVGHDDVSQLLARYVSSVDGTVLDAAEFELSGTMADCGQAGIAANPDLGHFGPGCLDYNAGGPWMTVFPTLHASPEAVTTDEGGGVDTFEVFLMNPPSADVTVLVTSGNPGEGTVDPTMLQFTVTGWDTPQTVTVTGVDDVVVDGNVAYPIDLTVENATSAPEYRYTVRSVVGMNLDDEVAPVVCGDGVQEGGEECDDGNTIDGDGCSANCEIEPVLCGDGVLDAGEDCDDGNTASGDGCSATCEIECGNGVREGSEDCDDGNNADGDGCSANCEIEPVLCGDGALDVGEECDDGNIDSGDGCDGCVVEDGWTCRDEPSSCEADKSTGCGCRATDGETLPNAALLLLMALFMFMRRRLR